MRIDGTGAVIPQIGRTAAGPDASGIAEALDRVGEACEVRDVVGDEGVVGAGVGLDFERGLDLAFYAGDVLAVPPDEDGGFVPGGYNDAAGLAVPEDAIAGPAAHERGSGFGVSGLDGHAGAVGDGDGQVLRRPVRGSLGSE